MRIKFNVHQLCQNKKAYSCHNKLCLYQFSNFMDTLNIKTFIKLQ